MEQQVETWDIAARVNIYLLEGIKEEYLGDQSNAGGRSVGQHWAHIHNVRLLWLQAAAPELVGSLVKIETRDLPNKDSLKQALLGSSGAIRSLLQKGLVAGKIKGFKPSASAFLGYLIAHEAHHRGQLLIALKENKHLPDKKILFGIWEWGSR